MIFWCMSFHRTCCSVCALSISSPPLSVPWQQQCVACRWFLLISCKWWVRFSDNTRYSPYLCILICTYSLLINLSLFVCLCVVLERVCTCVYFFIYMYVYKYIIQMYAVWIAAVFKCLHIVLESYNQDFAIGSMLFMLMRFSYMCMLNCLSLHVYYLQFPHYAEQLLSFEILFFTTFLVWELWSRKTMSLKLELFRALCQ